MKKISVLLAAVLLLVACLAACGGGQAGGGSTADYKAVLEAARPEELNSIALYTVVTNGDSGDIHNMIFSESFGFVEEDMDKYAISLGTVITKAYGVAIILPAEGREQAVIDQVNAFVEQQQKAQENYLQDQYEIAMGAIVKTAPTGEVLLAMCEDAADVMAKMEEGLKAG